MEGISNITISTSTFINNCNKKLFCKYWEPKLSRALVFLCHGYAEHCLIYEPLAQTLAANGYFVMSHDHMGHGQSEGSRVLVDNFDKFVDDVLQHVELVIKKQPQKLDVYICGHSMGGAIAILGALRKKDFFKGLILIGPAIKTNPEITTPLRVSLAKFLRWFAPQFPIATLDLNLISSSLESVKKMKTDPLRYHGFCKAGFGASLIEALQRIEEKIDDVSCPFIICQGEEDKICVPEGATLMYEKSTSHDKSIKMYPRAFHSLLIEPHDIADQVISDIVDWLNARTDTKT